MILRTEGGEILKPISAVAEYSFGNICEQHYLDYKKKLSPPMSRYVAFLEDCYSLAIHRYGLTYQQSLDKGVDAEKIWSLVEIDIKHINPKSCASLHIVDKV